MAELVDQGLIQLLLGLCLGCVVLGDLRQKLIELSRVEVHDGLLLGAAEESGVALRVVNLTAARE